MKIKLIAKLKEDDRNLSWFWSYYIHNQCEIMYSTFMNQLEGRGKIRSDVEEIINKFLLDFNQQKKAKDEKDI